MFIVKWGNKKGQKAKPVKEKKVIKEPTQGTLSPGDLRQRAEDALKGDTLEISDLTARDLEFIIHELQVHQVELQLQNEELRRLQLDLEISRDNYANLYNFAPICYCTLDQKGYIREANQMCSEIFGVENQKLIGQRLTAFIYREDQDHFYIHHQAAMKNRGKQVGEIRVIGVNGEIHYVQIQSVVSGEDRGIKIRVILSDITERKNLEQTLRESEANQAQRIRELHALHEATGSLLSTLDTETLLSRILEASLKAIPAAKIGVIYLIPADPRPLQISAFALSPDVQNAITFSNRSRYVTKVLSSKQRLLLGEIKTRTESNQKMPAEEIKTRSAMIVPLNMGDQIYGAISLESPMKNAFSETEMDLLGSFASTATAAILNARLHEQLQQTAITDFLTKVYNRQGFFEIGQHEFQRFLRSGRPLSLIALDVDGFKAINDKFGHAVGDQVLFLLGQRLLDQLRKTDVLGRYGGDEFIALLPETDLATGLKIARRLNRALDAVPIHFGDQSVRITISQGVAQATKEMDDLNRLLKKADDSLYKAKAAGRNRIKAAKME